MPWNVSAAHYHRCFYAPLPVAWSNTRNPPLLRSIGARTNCGMAAYTTLCCLFKRQTSLSFAAKITLSSFRPVFEIEVEGAMVQKMSNSSKERQSLSKCHQRVTDDYISQLQSSACRVPGTLRITHLLHQALSHLTSDCVVTLFRAAPLCRE